MRIMGTPASIRWCCSSRKKQGFRTVTKSVMDPDCGLFVKGEHKRQFAYEAHTACDKNGFVLETVVTPGNVHDSVAFDEVYCCRFRIQNASYLQESVRRWQSSFHSLQAPADHEGWPRVVEIGHMEMERPVVLVSLCCFFAHICSRSSLILSTDRVPRQTVAGKHGLCLPALSYLKAPFFAQSSVRCLESEF